jgi:transposase-like protein
VNVGELVERRAGSGEAKRKAAVLLDAIAGKLTMAEAAERLGVTEAMAYRLRDQLLEGVIGSLEPARVGRPASPAVDPEKTELESKVRVLERELEAAHIRADLLRWIPELGRGQKKKRAQNRNPGGGGGEGTSAGSEDRGPPVS